MSFLAPSYLWLLLAVAASAVGYVALQRRRRHHASESTNLRLLVALAPVRLGGRRNLPAAVILLALAGLVIGLSRPARNVLVPLKATVVLAIDVSNSMEAKDVVPSRIEAAKSAALNFVDVLPPQMHVGLVTFSAFAWVAVKPTTDRTVLRAGLEALDLNGGTAAGDALIAALESIIDSRRATERVSSSGSEPTADRIEGAAIVLLSDGKTTEGLPVEQAAATVAEHGVPVFTIVFGTDAGKIRGGIPVPVDRPTMIKVAEITGGACFEAASGDELRAIYESLSTQIGRERREFGMILVGGSLALLALAFAGLLWWNRRIPEKS